MFMNEFDPVFREFISHPIAFLGGFVSGVLHLNLADDPVRSWLDQQSGTSTTTTSDHSTGNGSGPQSITIE